MYLKEKSILIYSYFMIEYFIYVKKEKNKFQVKYLLIRELDGDFE